jgi:hypothetical protein
MVRRVIGLAIVQVPYHWRLDVASEDEPEKPYPSIDAAFE